jgi:hypothetical protein
MSDESGNWRELAALWHTRMSEVMPEEVEKHARRQRRHMMALATAEAGGLALAFIAAVWIAMHTAFVAMSAISLVFFAVSGYLHHRMRNEPEPQGTRDLMSSMREDLAREEWVLRQLGVGRAVSMLTLGSMLILGADHLRYFAFTPPARLWAMLVIAVMVAAVLVWNAVLTRRARARMRSLSQYAAVLGA